MSDGTTAPTRRLMLHVGSPKTGTTFLQEVLWSQRDLAREQGLLLPGERFFDHFQATLDVRGLADRPQHGASAVGAWKRLAEEAAAWEGTSLISHELFAAATREQAEEALAVLDAAGDVEVHVVLTARDLVRQIPAEWQEHVKHRSTRPVEGFVADIRRDRAGRSWFWKVQDFAGVLERWGSTLPPERLHVVTVPPAGADPGALWQRFAGLLGLDPAAFDTGVRHPNTSLGKEQAEVLRRVNAALGDRLPLPGPYAGVAKNVLAHRLLAGRRGTRITLTPDDAAMAVERGQAIADRLTARGVDVVGDLSDLVPDLDTVRAAADPAAYAVPSDAAMLEESVAAIAGLLTALADRRGQRRAEEMMRELRRSPVRFALIRASERNRALAGARRVYQKRHALTRRRPRS